MDEDFAIGSKPPSDIRHREADAGGIEARRVAVLEEDRTGLGHAVEGADGKAQFLPRFPPQGRRQGGAGAIGQAQTGQGGAVVQAQQHFGHHRHHRQHGGAALPQVGVQAVGVLAAAAWCGLGTWVILRIVAPVAKLRVSEEQETEGLDLAEHGERGYSP